MPSLVSAFLSTLLIYFPAAPLTAQEAHADHHATAVGRVHFPVSCAESVRDPFEQAVAMLHSFWYEEAEKAFAAIGETDPKCAMAGWGVAMSLWHPLWDQLTPPVLEKGWAVVEKAEALETGTEREHLYLAAIDSFYRDSATRDYARARSPTRRRWLSSTRAIRMITTPPSSTLSPSASMPLRRTRATSGRSRRRNS
jgi:hypothetical protein